MFRTIFVMRSILDVWQRYEYKVLRRQNATLLRTLQNDTYTAVMVLKYFKVRQTIEKEKKIKTIVFEKYYSNYSCQGQPPDVFCQKKCS